MIPPENILQHMAVPRQSNVYHIGCMERRVTLYSQQVRAINLAYALFTCKKLERGARVAVVGAGAAGLTATVALAMQGAEVTLLERLDAVIPLQSGNLTRWLHPHIYDWPAEGCRDTDAGLPLLNWSAGYAADIAANLREEFYRYARQHTEAVKVHTGVRNVQLLGAGPSPRVEWNDSSGGFQSERFATVILAVGFGLERSALAPVLSYWRNDDLAQYEMETERTRHYLVSGCGDGGLVDLLRLRIRDFRHDRMLEEFVGKIPNQSLEEALLRSEETARQMTERGENPAEFLYEEYRRTRPPDMDMRVAVRLRRDTSATLNGSSLFPWSLEASILNRFMASALIGLRTGDRGATSINITGADWWRGKIANVSQQEGTYRVKLESGESRVFDRVILRHGPSPTISQWMQASDVDSIRSRNALDQTRAPLWPKGYFGEPVAPRSKPESRKRTIQVLIPSIHEKNEYLKLEIELESFTDFNDLSDFLYVILSSQYDLPIKPYAYGKDWRLRNKSSGQEILHARELATNKSFGQPVADFRTLEETGVLPGDVFEVVFLKR